MEFKKMEGGWKLKGRLGGREGCCWKSEGDMRERD